MRMKVGIIIQARMTSTRLPGKILLPVMGKALLEYQVERLKRVKRADEIIIATTINETDQPIIDLASRLGIKIFRGSEEDVLARYFGAAKENGLEVVVRITSDCPLIDPAVVSLVIDTYLKNLDSCDYVSSCLHRTFPRGMDTEAFPFEILKETYEKAVDQPYREHVTPYIYEHDDRYRLLNVPYLMDASQYRLTVDTPEDFVLIELILKELYPGNPFFKLEDVLELMKNHPEWAEINSQVEQKKLR
ncbi:spore coat polysaccharide biosynthesis protein F, CMP-KDO synthetase [Desulfosporosinus acidiphilus SJ4]|uniref:Spore coat polysaccharide biosynthesis protein F, CMP-KDO synthetase n=1 Tax=Desulfosporosinus acidiphilus (strain DSM 22704 / JCM 16185 / SJ4) TaxID=646529 RepID=I4DA99_DESAJ|nr:glycosyltransferase family protein [Desulfosporosinus acidiphilus]AFM42723.1 spore coat polysaccharide biosynthesis protein F, CMP-KDO synthetase [Desulfosporosinus acidiphilus SJ4]